MPQLLAITVLIAGAALGIGCGLLFRRSARRADLAHGLAVVLASFIVISAAIFAIKMLMPEMTLAFGTLSAMSFLLTSSIALISAHGKSL